MNQESLKNKIKEGVAYELHYTGGPYKHVQTFTIVNSQKEIYLDYEAFGAEDNSGQRHLLLKEQEWDQIEKFIGSMNFWNLPPEQEERNLAQDGNFWTLEAVNGEKYHKINRNPSSENSLPEIKEIIKLHGFLKELTGV